MKQNNKYADFYTKIRCSEIEIKSMKNNMPEGYSTNNLQVPSHSSIDLASNFSEGEYNKSSKKNSSSKRICKNFQFS